MPDLRKISFDEADSICKLAGVELLPARIRSDDKLPPGIVIDQYPQAGSIVKPGRRAEVVVSGTAGLVPCPEVIGKAPSEAGLIADSSGLWLNIEAIRYRFSEIDPEGVIIEQSPLALTGLLKGSELRITVSLGSEPLNPSVPDLIGVNIENATLMLRKQGLRLGEVVKYPDRNHHPGTIIEQSMAPGASIGMDNIVNVRVAVEPIGGFSEEVDSSVMNLDPAISGDSEHE